MTTFIERLDGGPAGAVRVAVKDCIDVQGVPSTWGSPAVVAEGAGPAAADAACLTGIRSSGARIVGKANLQELCFGSTGVNPWFGTPVSPFGADLVPGGSSSGSAVAVVSGEADVGIGTDTTGSVRTPAAWCGAAALRTTFGRIPLGGVAPLAPSLDVVGPIARDVAGLVTGMALLEPGFAPAVPSAWRIGRLHGTGADPVLEEAVDAALAEAGLDVVEVHLPGFDTAAAHGRTVLLAEAWAGLGDLYRRHARLVGEEVAGRFEQARRVGGADLARARRGADRWRAEVAGVLDRVDAVALPTHRCLPPTIASRDPSPNALAVPASLAGLPALALPVRRAEGGIPASLQLVGGAGREDVLLAIGAVVEAAAGWSHG